MHDAAFAVAALPSPARVLGLSLRPYSIGHELWLLREDSPFAKEDRVSTGPDSRSDLIRAVWTCSLTWKEIRGGRADWLKPLKLAIWTARLTRMDFDQAETAFRDYLLLGSDLAPTDRDPKDTSRPLGGPHLARLILFLIRELRKTEEEAFDYPMALANWHYATWLEKEGAVRVLNEDEVGFLKWVAEQEENKGLGAGRSGGDDRGIAVDADEKRQRTAALHDASRGSELGGSNG